MEQQHFPGRGTGFCNMLLCQGCGGITENTPVLLGGGAKTWVTKPLQGSCLQSLQI